MGDFYLLSVTLTLNTDSYAALTIKHKICSIKTRLY